MYCVVLQPWLRSLTFNLKLAPNSVPEESIFLDFPGETPKPLAVLLGYFSSLSNKVIHLIYFLLNAHIKSLVYIHMHISALKQQKLTNEIPSGAKPGFFKE